jgi:pimeloyl-ACP methyl ester carboxylesterase
MKVFTKKSHTSIYFVVFMLLLSSCATQHRFAEFRHRKVHHFEMVPIGGVKQAIMINGKIKDNPVLVYLHGGPGFPMLPFEPFENQMKELEKHFTIVYWEQRGTGKSFSPSIDNASMNVEQFVNDTREVIEYTRELLGVEKVFLWGHSWGSNLGAIYASRYPETLYAYISTGQSANPFLNERLAYEFVKENAIRDNNARALRQLSKIDTVPENYRVKDALTIRKWVYRYGGIVFDNSNERPYVDLTEIRTILTTPLYSWRARYNLVMNPYFSIENLWDDLKDLNLFQDAPRIEVPVYFLVGRHDIIVSHVLAEKYFDHIKAPEGKQLIWFEKSAHRPYSEEAEKFQSVMLQIHQVHIKQSYTQIEM